MSAKTTGAIWDLNISVPQRMVLLAMVDHADHDGEHMNAPATFIAWKTGYHIRSVYRIIQDLIDSGILIVTDTSLGEANEYKIDLSRGAMKAAYRGRKPQTRVATPDKIAGGKKRTPDKMSVPPDKIAGGDVKMSVPPDKMSPPTPDILAIDKESSLSRENHESPPPPVPTGGIEIGGGGEKTNKTELYHWLRAQGVDSPDAAERNQHHDLDLTKAMFARMVGQSVGDQRRKLVGRFIKALDADGPPRKPAPTPATVPRAVERPADLIDPSELPKRILALGTPTWARKPPADDDQRSSA